MQRKKQGRRTEVARVASGEKNDDAIMGQLLSESPRQGVASNPVAQRTSQSSNSRLEGKLVRGSMCLFLMAFSVSASLESSIVLTQPPLPPPTHHFHRTVHVPTFHQEQCASFPSSPSPSWPPPRLSCPRLLP